MEWLERGFRLVFMVLFGVMFSGVFMLLALETTIRRWRDDRRAGREAPVSELEAGYRERSKAAARGSLVARPAARFGAAADQRAGVRSIRISAW